MRIAFVEAFPNRPFTAEREFAASLAIACTRLGHEVVQPTTSDDILAAAPDVVLASHEFVPKLTGHLTLGVNWNPPADFEEDPLRQKNLTSYDGHLSGGPSISRHIADTWFSTGQDRPVHEFFYPSSPCIGDGPAPGLSGGAPRLFYVGAHWDSRRFGPLFRMLERRGIPLDVFGPARAWTGLRHSWRGELPVDGLSLILRLGKSGASLALHRDAHRQAGIPSMRLFESAAAGAVIISDDFDFPRRAFGDTVLYVDMARPMAEVATQIAGHMAWISDNPAAAREMAAASAEQFREALSLEALLEPLPDFVADAAATAGYAPRPRRAPEPIVEIVMRIGSRPVEMVGRAVAAIAAQSYQRIALTLVAFDTVEGIDALVERYRCRFESIRNLAAPKGCRSTAMWTGLQAATGDIVGMLDDDDEIHPNHVESLVRLIEQSGQTDNPTWAFAGTVLFQEGGETFAMQPNFLGPGKRVIRESRALRLFRPYNDFHVWHCDNMIGNGAWLADRRLLSDRVLVDPNLDYVEDVYLYMMLSLQARPLFSWRATLQWNMRLPGGNSSFDKDAIRYWVRRVMRRTAHLRSARFELISRDETRVLSYLTEILRRVYAWRRPGNQLRVLLRKAGRAMSAVNPLAKFRRKR